MAHGGLVRFYGEVQVPTRQGTNTIIEYKKIVFTTTRYADEYLQIPLDHPAKVLPAGFPTTNVEQHTRTIIQIDAAGTETTLQVSVASHERSTGGTYGVPGSKTAILICGKRVGSTFNRISFRFPGFVTAKEISDLLGTVIPAARISSTPDATQIRPFFRIKGGRTYPIMSASGAAAEDEARPGWPALPPATP